MMKKMFPTDLLGYPWSKLTSEQALGFAQRVGMPLAIFSPAADQTCPLRGSARWATLGVRLFASVADCETLPEGFTFRTSNEAVDTLSRVCVAISLTRSAVSRSYHCCNPKLDQYDLEPADFGLYWRTVPYDSFKRACQARGESSPMHGYWTVFDHFRRYCSAGTNRAMACRSTIARSAKTVPLPFEWIGTFTKLRRTHDWVNRHR